MLQLAVAQGPYNSAFDKYCGDGQAQGLVTIGDSTYTYLCNHGQNAGADRDYFKTSSPDSCAEGCNNKDGCDIAVWDRKEGKCWIGKAGEARKDIRGRITMIKHDESGVCLAELEKYKPLPASSVTCPEGNGKITEANDTRFHVVCDEVIPNSATKKADGEFNSFEDCLDGCASDSTCTVAAYDRRYSTCFYATASPFSKEWIKSSHYDSGIKLSS